MRGFLILILFQAFTLSSCLDGEIESPTRGEIFQDLWEFINEHYIYFDVKQVDWEELRLDYEDSVINSASDQQFFQNCSLMLEELRDGHNSLLSVNYGRSQFDFKKGYDIHFSKELIESTYLNSDFSRDGNYTYGLINDSLVYIHLSRFYGVDRIHSFMNKVDLWNPKGLILDLRDNPGGVGADAVEIVSHLIDQPTGVGFIIEKVGPSTNDLSAPLPVIASPSLPYLDLPIKVLMNRRTYSAATYLIGEIKDLPNVELIGQISGGGGGGNMTYELVNGWLVTVSVSKYLDTEQAEVEEGILPDVVIENDSMDLVNGIDKMLNMAINRF